MGFSNLKRLVNGVYLPLRAATTAPVSVVALAVNVGYSRLPGRTVDWNWNAENWVFVCSGAPTSLGAGATTFGAVINTKLAYSDFLGTRDGRLMAHETKHTDQWAIFGLEWFAVLYGLAAVVDWTGTKVFGWKLGCHNPFEMWAGLVDGGYR